MVSKTMTITLLTVIAAFCGIVLWNILVETYISCYSLCCGIFIGIVLIREIPRLQLVSLERKLYLTMLSFFSQVKQKYTFGKNITNAVYDAAREQCYEIRLHAMELYGLLTNDNRKNRVRNYVCSSGRNKYWKMLLVQLYETSEHGDRLTPMQTSMFAENVEQLRMELMYEIQRERQKRHSFSGYVFVTLTPVFTMSVLKGWGLGFSTELQRFYSQTGHLIVLLCFIVTILVYEAICRVKKSGGIYSEAGNEIKQFQTILWMERRFPEMTIVGMLEDLESFSVVFQPMIRECINSYSAGPRRALLQLKKNGVKRHPAFAELVEEFLAVDEVGIEAAFAGVENNRKMLEQTEQFEADIKLEFRKDGIELLAKVPAILVVGLYFIIPFMLSALSGVSDVFTLIEGLRL